MNFHRHLNRWRIIILMMILFLVIDVKSLNIKENLTTKDLSPGFNKMFESPELDEALLFIQKSEYQSAAKIFAKYMNKIPSLVSKQEHRKGLLSWVARNHLLSLIQLDMKTEVIDLARKYLEKWNIVDNWRPGDNLYSIHCYMGVSAYNLGRIDIALEAFKYAADNFNEPNSWLYLGDSLINSNTSVKEAWEAYIKASELLPPSLEIKSRLFKAATWIANWDHHDEQHALIENAARQSMANKSKSSVNMLDYYDFHPSVELYLNQQSAFAQDKVPLNLAFKSKLQLIEKKHSQLRIGFISSDFGVHPVSSLIRGALLSFTTPRFHVTAYSLTKSSSWWKRSIENGIDEMKSLFGMSGRTAATAIAADNIHILIDLNGQTLSGGLPILAYRPAPITMHYLGFSASTGANFVDYYIGDVYAAPPDVNANYFSEKLIYMPPSFMVTDGSLLQRNEARLDRQSKYKAGLQIPQKKFVFATFCSFRKISPTIFRVWASILKQVPNSVLWILQHYHFKDAIDQLKLELEAAGVSATRLISSPQVSWSIHTHTKSAADLVLDTVVKNGHTSTYDALWAGVPVVTLPGMKFGQRWAASLLHAIGADELIAVSLKDYESLAVHLATNPVLLAGVRKKIESRRWTQSLFRVMYWQSNFESLLTKCWELHVINQNELNQSSNADEESVDNDHNHNNRRMHILPLRPFSSTSTSNLPSIHETLLVNSAETLQRFNNLTLKHQNAPPRRDSYSRGGSYSRSSRSTVTSTAKYDKRNYDNNDNSNIFLSKDDLVLLNIGGESSKDRWTIVNAMPDEKYVDIVTDMSDLSMFKDNSVDVIYSSHTLEHISYRNELIPVLNEWHRVLKSGGILMVSVPDLRSLAKLFIDDSLTLQQRFEVSRIIYGGHMSEYDFHKGGFDVEILVNILSTNGFCGVVNVPDFTLFNDTSILKVHGVAISINVMSRKCGPATVERVITLLDRDGKDVDISTWSEELI